MSRDEPFFAPKAYSINCEDPRRSAKFYEEVLGARRIGESDIWHLGLLPITFNPSADKPSPSTYPRHASACLWVEVDDMREAKEFFARIGVVVLENYDDLMIVIADPDGLPIEVTGRQLPPGRFRMVRVLIPATAPDHARGEITIDEVGGKHGDAVTPAERDAMLARRDEILALVDAQVEDYANRGCAPSGQDWFPMRTKLNGEYYIGSESYHKLKGADWCQIRVNARCLTRGREGPEDYLGLDVWIRYDPRDGRLWVDYGPDSHVI